MVHLKHVYNASCAAVKCTHHVDMAWEKCSLPPLQSRSNKTVTPQKTMKIFRLPVLRSHTGLVCWGPFPGITVQGSGIHIHTEKAFLGCLLSLSDGAVGCLPEREREIEQGRGAGGIEELWEGALGEGDQLAKPRAVTFLPFWGAEMWRLYPFNLLVTKRTA